MGISVRELGDAVTDSVEHKNPRGRPDCTGAARASEQIHLAVGCALAALRRSRLL